MKWIRKLFRKILPYPLQEGVVVFGRLPERLGHLPGRVGERNGRCPGCGMRPLTPLEYQWVKNGRLKVEEVRAKMTAELKKHGDFTTPTRRTKP